MQNGAGALYHELRDCPGTRFKHPWLKKTVLYFKGMDARYIIAYVHLKVALLLDSVV